MIPDSIRNRAHDLALHCGFQPKVVMDGLPEAMAVWNAFISNMPNKLKTPAAFQKVLENNYELVYGMIEAAGLKLGSELVRLKDLVADQELNVDEAYEETVRNTGIAARHHPTFICKDDSGDISHEDDGLPFWKVVVVFAGSKEDMSTFERITIVVDHRDMARYFNKATVVLDDPDPAYGEAVNIIDTDGHGGDDDDDEDAPGTGGEHL
jgi:hypothetical protein